MKAEFTHCALHAHDLAADNIEIDGPREPDRLVEPSIERSRRAVFRPPAGRHLQRGMDDESALRRGQAVSGQNMLSAQG